MAIKRAFSLNYGRTQISEDEAALYDRQIRLWGIESQQRLRSTTVLLIGLGGLGAEVAKNIVLAGVKSITLFDNKKVEPNDFASQFLLAGAKEGENRAEASKARVKQLNPNVEVTCETGNLHEKTDFWYLQFSVICATDCSPEILLKLSEASRKNDILLFIGDTWGYHGYCFLDLAFHTYFLTQHHIKHIKHEPAPKKKKFVSKVERTEFATLEHALSIKSGKTGVGLHKKMSKVFFLVHLLMKFREVHKRLPAPQHYDEDLKSLTTLRKTVMEKLGFEESKISDEDLKNVFGEISPVCAIVGGIMAQEVIKAVCRNQQPIKNFFLFDGDTCVGVVESVGCTPL